MTDTPPTPPRPTPPLTEAQAFVFEAVDRYGVMGVLLTVLEHGDVDDPRVTLSAARTRLNVAEAHLDDVEAAPRPLVDVLAPDGQDALDHVRLERAISHHAPTDQATIDTFSRLRAAAKAYGHLVIDNTPRGYERGQALMALEQASMWAIAAVARPH